MSTHSDTTAPLESNCLYHIFNRGNKGIKIFYEDRNYSYFLRKYDTQMSPYLDTYSYILIPNHFHFLIKVKSATDIFNNAIKENDKVSKLMWKAIKNEAEKFPIEFFNDYFAFMGLINQRYPGDKLKLRQFIDILPPILLPVLASWIVSDSFRKLFAPYARAINKQEGQTGSLFQKNFRRKAINSETYFTYLIWYIHNNAVHHGICNQFQNYRWSVSVR